MENHLFRIENLDMYLVLGVLVFFGLIRDCRWLSETHP